MPRFFTGPISGDRAVISGEDAGHITKSLRLRPGEAVTLCDGSGFDYSCVLVSVGETVEAEVLEKLPSSTEPRGKITLFQALPKGDKMEWIIQKSVELGVFRIVPVLTSRCVSRPDGKSMEKKVPRYNKIAAEAAKQCGRGILPEVSGLMTLKEAAEAVSGKGIVFYEKGGARLPELVSPSDSELSVFVGSEGGFAPEEIALLGVHGVVPATLGSRILRCETAPICGLSILMSLLGDI